MKTAIISAITCVTLATPLLASGDAAKGEADFKKCKACHAITAADGTDIVKGGKVGPNLFGVVGRTAGTVPDFKYSNVMVEAGAKGLVWSEETLVGYLPDPSEFLEEYADDAEGKSKMTFKLTKGAEDMAAYLASLSAE